jgi:outer membrane protein
MRLQYKALLSFMLAFTTQGALADDLLAIYRKALVSDPQFLAAQANERAGQEAINQALSVLLPQVSASWSKSDDKTESKPGVLVFGGTPFPSTPSTTDSNTTVWSLSLQQQVYHHDSWIGLSIAEKQAEQAKLAAQAEKQALALRVAEAYFNVLAAQDGLEFATAEKESIAKQLEQTKQKFDVGLTAITDVHEAQARYDQAVANEILAQNQLDNAQESMRQIIGVYPSTLARLKTDVPLIAPAPANIADWMKVAERSNLLMRSKQLAAEIARDNIKRQEAGHLPTVDLVGSYSDRDTDGTNNSNDFFNGSTSRSISLQVQVPIYSGGRTHSGVVRAQADYERATQELEQTHRQVIRDTRSAYLGVTASIASVKALQQSLVSTESALEATKAGFDVGTRTMVDVLLATTNYFNAKRNLARKRYDYVLNVLRLKQAAGILTDDDLARVNQWLQR